MCCGGGEKTVSFQSTKDGRSTWGGALIQTEVVENRAARGSGTTPVLHVLVHQKTGKNLKGADGQFVKMALGGSGEEVVRRRFRKGTNEK